MKSYPKILILTFAVFSVASPRIATSDVSPGVDRLWIQTGSFRDVHAATRVVNEWENRGGSPQIFIADNGWYVVTFGTMHYSNVDLLPSMISLFGLPTDTMLSDGERYNEIGSDLAQD